MSANRLPRYESYRDSENDWLGDVPTHWSVARMSKLSTKITNGYVGPTRGLFVDSGVKYLQSLHIKNNRIVFTPTYFVTEAWSKTKEKSILREGDVLVVQTGDVGQAACVPAEFAGANCHALIVVATNERKILGRYLSSCLNSHYGQRTLMSIQTGALHPHLNCGTVKFVELPVPPISEQSSILAFLDYETAKIDALIAMQQQLIALLGEKRQAVISHAVTKGLNPDAPMRDSGIEWLGEVPEHWKIMTVRNMLRAGALQTQDGNHGELHPVAADYVDEGIPFLMANNVRHGRVSLNPCNFLTREHADRLRIGFARRGDLLLTHKGTVGEVAMVPDSVGDDYWMLTPQVTYYRWQSEGYVTKFFYFLFQSLSVLEQLRVIGGKQSTRAYVGLVAQKELVLVVPPITEQNAISDHLGGILENLDTLSGKADTKIELLQERRTALISAAVTGKIDVRGWKPPSSARMPETEMEVA